MKSNIFALNWVGIASYAVASLAALAIYTILVGKRIPFVGNEKAAFIILWIIGLSMSILGGTRDYPDGKFTMPGFLMGFLMLLGFLAILLMILMLIGTKIPFIPTYRVAVYVLAAIIITKWAAVHLYKVFHLFL